MGARKTSICAQQHRMLAKLVIFAALVGMVSGYQYTSAYSSGYTSGYTSGDTSAPTGAPTGAPTASPTLAPTTAGAASSEIKQSIDFAIKLADYKGTQQLLVEMGYSCAVGMCNAKGTELLTGCAISSTAAAATRRADKITVSFVAKVPASIKANAEKSAKALTPAILKGSMDKVKAADTKFKDVTVPTASNIKAPTVTLVVSGVARATALSAVALVAGFLAIRH